MLLQRIGADSARIARDAEYISTLERTNQQLSLGWTPYAVTFTILAVLVAFVTLGAGFLIYQRDAEYKKQLADIIAKYTALMNQTFEEGRARFDVLETQILAKQAERESLKGEQQKEIDSQIEQLRQAQEVVKQSAAAAGVPIARRPHDPIPVDPLLIDFLSRQPGVTMARPLDPHSRRIPPQRLIADCAFCKQVIDVGRRVGAINRNAIREVACAKCGKTNQVVIT